MQLERIFTHQPAEHTPEEHRIWGTLCQRQQQVLRDRACRQFTAGLQRIALDFSCMPRLDDINQRIAPITGWKARAVRGLIEPAQFFECLRQGIYPTTVIIRSAESMDYIEAPDIFHDVFGHVALMADPVYGDLMRAFGHLHEIATSDQDILEMTRLFWFTVEFGLIAEEGRTQILGSGLLSSPGEAVHCLSDRVTRRPFRLSDVIAQPFRVDVYQDVLFVADSLEQLIASTQALMDQFTRRNHVRWPAGGKGECGVTAAIHG